MRLLATNLVGSDDTPAEMRAAGPSRPEFRSLFDAEFAYVWRALRRLGVREADLEDVTHEVFLAVFRKFDSFDPSRPSRPWLFAFALRFASDYRALSRHRYEVLGEASEREATGPDALERALQNEALKTARDALASVELERRAVLILHELDEYSIPEVAHALGIPLGTAYSRLRLARADLARALHRLRLRGER